MRSYFRSLAVAVFLTVATNANAATIEFLTDPFAGSSALTTPGRQVVGGEPSIIFDIATDVFVFDPLIFGISGISFANELIGDLPTSGINTVVLQTFDNDADPTTPFGAGNAASLIAAQITSPGAGFFIYFNSGLDFPRLVFSTDLDDPISDLKVLARMTNLAGAPGRAAIPTFSADNFDVTPTAVPEPATLSLLTAAGVWSAARQARRRRTGR